MTERCNYESNENILAAIAAGDQMVWTFLYSQLKPMALNLVLKNSGSKDDAQETLHKAMIIFYQKVIDPEFKLTVKASTFIYSICHFQWLKSLRDDNNPFIDYNAILEDVNDSEKTAQEKDLEQQEYTKEQECLDRCIKMLGNKCQKVIRMFYLAGKSMQEIADTLDYTNAKNAKNQKYKCFKQLTLLVKENCRKKGGLDD